MVDPKNRRHTRAVQPSTEPVSLAEIHGLLLELAPLRGLGWAPLAQRIERLATALRGGEGVGEDLVLQLRTWAHRWARVHADLRAFYTRNAQHPAAEAAMWRIFEGGERLTGPLRGDLDRLWIEDHGAAPDITLVPMPRPQASPRSRP